MKIVIRDNYNCKTLWAGKVRSQKEANRRTGDFIKQTGLCAITWRELGAHEDYAFNSKGQPVVVTIC